MSFLYEFPPNATFGKVLPKNKIYENASPTAVAKTLFVREVDKIIWSYKLSPGTINLPAKGDIQEIEVFTIFLRTGTIKDVVLSTIDKAIPAPILFVLSYENRSRYVAAHKRQSDADKNKWVLSSYFRTEWIPDDTKRIALPVVLDLRALYHSILKGMIPISARQNETLAELINRVEELRTKERESSKTKARLIKGKTVQSQGGD